jgi:hypothetical protein
MSKTTNVKKPAGLAAAKSSAKHRALIANLSNENNRYRAALERISKWFGEFPATGRAWDDGKPMSYSAAFGSNGERDFMRQIATDALSPNVVLRQDADSAASNVK